MRLCLIARDTPMGADAISQFEQNGWFASVRPGARVRVAANHMHSSRDEDGSSSRFNGRQNERVLRRVLAVLG